jgi:geranylgeranyl pyrophosphate synthase
LAVDDIEDDSKLRRGKPCLHLIYGTDVAINAGNGMLHLCFNSQPLHSLLIVIVSVSGMYFFPLVVFRDLKKKGFADATINKCYELYSEEMIKLHFGQGLDIWWHTGKGNPSADEYLQMCAYKTGTLARLSAKLSAIISGGSEAQAEAIGKFAETIGVAFQIQVRSFCLAMAWNSPRRGN